MLERTLEHQLPFKNYDQILNFWPFFRLLFPRASYPLAFSYVPAQSHRNVIEDRRRSFVGSSSFDHPRDKFTRQDMHLCDNGLSIGSRVTNSRHIKGSSKHDAIVKARGSNASRFCFANETENGGKMLRR